MESASLQASLPEGGPQWADPCAVDEGGRRGKAARQVSSGYHGLVRAPGARRFLAAKALVGSVLALGVSAGVARADGPDPAAALFDRGLADMQAHRYATACPELAESYRLDPHAGGLFTLA